jgi:1,4-dihydroxy-2-naphthoyl-CoA hydrolase
MTLQDINLFCKDTMVAHLGIEFTKVSEGFVEAHMPVDEKTRQPMGFLHGGASLALSETIGSAGSALLVDRVRFDVLGTQVSANHLATVSSGYVIAQGLLKHKGRTSHIWDVEIKDEKGRLISVARVTNAIIEKRR